jgi:hypothetical protein
MDPIAMILADRATTHHVRSARPASAVEPDQGPRPRGRSDAVRRVAAGRLRRLADRVEPSRAQACRAG